MSVADRTASAAAPPRRSPFAVRLSAQFVNRLCARLEKAAADGTELAGLLFGVSGEGLAIVQAFKSFPAPESVESGPFAGERLEKAVRRCIAASHSDPEVSALDLIGWYALRSEPGLHAPDIGFHNRYFPRPDDLALILKPEDPSTVLLQLYAGTISAVMSPEDHRWGALRLATDLPVAGPIEVTMRHKAHEEAQQPKEQLQSLDRALERGDWKSRLRNRTRAPLPVPTPNNPPVQDNPPVQKESSAKRSESAPAIPAESLPPATEAKIVRPVLRPVPRERAEFPEPLAPGARINAGEPPGVPALFSSRQTRRSPWFFSAILFAVIAIAAGVTFAFLLVRALPSGTAMPGFLRAILPDTGLALHVETQGDRVLLTWNRHNAVVRSASDAILHIDDGSQHRNVHLDAAQAGNGSVLYRPGSDDVVFRLEVHGQQGATIADSVRVLDGTQNQPLDLSAKADTSAPAEPSQNRPTPAARSNAGVPTIPTATSSTHMEQRSSSPERKVQITEGGTAPAAPEQSVRDQTNSDAGPPILVSNDAAPPAAVPESSAPASETAAPISAPAHSSPATPPPTNESSGKPTVSSPASDTPEVRTAPAPQATTQPPKLVPSASPAPLGTPHPTTALSDFKPPHPIRQILPDTRSLSPSILSSGAEVEVQVRVDTSGHVIAAHIVDHGKRIKEALAGSALMAAEKWLFQPATAQGRPVASDHTIVFQFSPATR